MLLSGGLAGLMAINVLMGDQQRLVLDYTAGAGFVGIAVALMGRSHPFGIVLASILFGALYQGGAELAFDKPNINRDMIVVIQGMVILFAGALEQMFKPQLAALFARMSRRAAGPGLMWDIVTQLPVILASTVRLSVPLIFCCLAGLYSERSGIVDIGLEGKMLAAAFAAAVIASTYDSAWLGLAAGIVVAVLFSLVHGVSSISYRGNQIVSGVAINMLALGLTALLGNVWYGQGGRTPTLDGAARFQPIDWPFVEAMRGRAGGRARSMPRSSPATTSWSISPFSACR